MLYSCDLGYGQKIYLENRDGQTNITSMNVSPGQQQQSTNTMSTGQWLVPPTVWRMGNTVMIRVEGELGQKFIQLQGSQISALATTPNVSQAEVLSLQQVSQESFNSVMKPMTPMKPMEPMKPMVPMKMGNMEMHMNPMEMRMGNMEMRLGDSISSQGKRFCSQCGTPIQESDRFCASCGHRLH